MTIRAKYTEAVALPPKMPSIIQRVVNLAASVAPIIRSRFGQVPESIRVERLAICERCEFWSPEAYRGTGGCTHPKCGCSIGKLLFSGAECPIGLWGKYTFVETATPGNPATI